MVGAIPGRTLLEELWRIRKSIDRAVLILSPESTTVVRRKKHAIPNLNVLFEFGFFYSALGKDRVAVVRYGVLYLPSDLDGYIHITGSKHFTRGHGVVVGKRTKEDFDRWLFPGGKPTQSPSGARRTNMPRVVRSSFVSEWRR